MKRAASTKRLFMMPGYWQLDDSGIFWILFKGYLDCFVKNFTSFQKKSFIERVIDRNTKAIITSSVQEVTGERVNLKQLAELAKSYESYVFVDGIQEAGVMEINLSETELHAYCVGGHKWIGNPFRLGFMYVHPSLYGEMMPCYEGYFNQQEPDKGWEHYLQSRKRTPFDKLVPISEAKKFETGGTPHWLGAIGLRSAVQFIADEGISNIQRQVDQLHQRLKKNLKVLGLGDFILGKKNVYHPSSIVTFGLPGGLEKEKTLAKRLDEEGVYVSLRSISGVGGIRVSPYFTNTREDIDRLCEITESVL